MTLPDVKILFWCLLVACTAICDGYKILAIFPIPAGSHRIQAHGVIKHLLKAGHEVTYITPSLMKNDNPKLRQIDVTDNVNAWVVTFVNIPGLMKGSTAVDQERIFNVMMNVTMKTLENENVLRLLNDKTEHFDLVLAQWMFNEVITGVSAVFDCPYAWYIPYEPNFATMSLIDEYTNPSYSANVDYSDIPPFNFVQRLKSLFYQTKNTMMYYFHYRNIEKKYFDKTFSKILEARNKPLPSYEEIRLNASLVLGNYHVSFGQGLKLPQNYIPVGGQHIDEDVAPLPKELKKIMDEAKHGVIYFSMGSIVKSTEFPESIKMSLFKVFGELKQTVIWKFEERFPDMPENVHIMDWAPQHSILSHPNCILFITHGGLLSTIEAVHFGVPLLTVPMYFDHIYNANKSVKKGTGVKVELTENMAEDLRHAIQEMLNNPKYRERMNEAHYIYHNRIATPGKELVHWVEHVIRTRGALHLRSPAITLPWYQKMYLDLVAIVLLVLCTIILGAKKLNIFKVRLRLKTKSS